MQSYHHDGAARALWNLDPAFTFLNHGSYGAVPGSILEKRYQLELRLESQPVRFFMREFEELLSRARERLSKFLGADPEGLVFVHNATTGVNTVLKSLRFSPGDEILITDHIYNACRNVVHWVVSRDGATVNVVETPFPISSRSEVLNRILDRVSERTKLVLIDHVTSPTALVFPVEEIVAEMSLRGIDVLIDGAHAPGMLPLNLRALGAAYYTGNCHKWMCAPKGSAFLYIREDRRRLIRPLVTSHGANSPRQDKSFLHLEFDWVGTDDYTPFLLIPDCIEFLDSLYPGGVSELMARNHDLAVKARDMLCREFNVPVPCPDDMIGSMASVPVLPLDPEADPAQRVDKIQDKLFHEFRIEVPVISWPSSGRRLVRISCQAYNSMEDYLRLADALKVLIGERV